MNVGSGRRYQRSQTGFQRYQEADGKRSQRYHHPMGWWYLETSVKPQKRNGFLPPSLWILWVKPDNALRRISVKMFLGDYLESSSATPGDEDRSN